MSREMTMELRLSESVWPFGVGAIADVLRQSVIGMDTDYWDANLPTLECARLTDHLGGGRLIEPPVLDEKSREHQRRLPYLRFPAWRYCERCERLSKMTPTKRGSFVNECECGGSLIPMRFVAVCQEGSHIQDIPWFKWTHRGRDAAVTDAVRSCKSTSELRFIRSASGGEGLASLKVVCNGCGRERSLAELNAKDALRREGISCDGRQPWEQEGADCDSTLVPVQRGATSNYIAEMVSALDIPDTVPESVEVERRVRLHPLFMKCAGADPTRQRVLGEVISEDLGIDITKILEMCLRDREGTSQISVELKDGEWAAFVQKLKVGRDHTSGDFIVDGWAGRELSTRRGLHGGVLCGLAQVRRVREVRALMGFRRYQAQASFISADLGSSANPRRYPAIETFGEGIFLRFDEDRLREWELDAGVKERVDVLTRAWARSEWSRRLDVPEPRFIALHTVAHLLIRRLSFESGYSSASLSERIYARSDRSDRTAGILIYTSAGDSQGTLGGLVRLGEPARLLPILVAALADGETCSNDPVCMESDGQLTSGLNLAACHGCCFVSETSCETGNRLLDRRLVLGGDGIPGLLESVLRTIRLGAVS